MVLKMAAARVVPDFVAVHMTWGAINELSTLHAYRRVVANTGHPVLGELLARIVKDERRHYAFYAGQARKRLDGNPAAQRLVRWALDRFWAPVGTGVRPLAETDHVVLCLFGDAAGREVVAEMEAELSRLPGLSGTRLLRRALAQAERRSGGPGARVRTRPPIAAALG